MVEAIIPFLKRNTVAGAYPNYSGQTFGVAIIASQSNDVYINYSPNQSEPDAPLVPQSAGIKLNDAGTALEAMNWLYGYSNQMALTFNQYTEGQLAVYNGAVSGTNVYGEDGGNHWGLNGSLLAPAKEKLANMATLLGGNDKIKYIVMGSKEAGAFNIGNSTGTKQQWIDSIISIVNDLSAIYTNAEFLLPSIGIRKDWTLTRLNDSFGVIRNAQKVELPALNPKIKYVRCDTHLKSENYYDNIHWGTAVHNEVGKLLAASMVSGLTINPEIDSNNPFVKSANTDSLGRINLYLNEAFDLNGTLLSSFSINKNGSNATIESMSASSSERLLFTLSTPVVTGDTITITYLNTGSIIDLSTNSLDPFSNYPVTNNT